jgi:hypothetical protein
LGCLAADYFSAVLIRKGALAAETRVRSMTVSALLLPFVSGL